MEKILVYLGSDHVIQHPSFGVRENILKMTTDREVAISQACEQDAAGVINTYSLDLDSLSVKAPEQQVLNGFDGYDVVIPQEEAACYISICSEAALNSLVFTNASCKNNSITTIHLEVIFNNVINDSSYVHFLS